MFDLYTHISLDAKACMSNISNKSNKKAILANTSITRSIKTHYTLFHWHFSVREGRWWELGVNCLCYYLVSQNDSVYSFHFMY